ncbi:MULTISPECIES: 2-hydroxyacid dehydrogenase [Lelliottia]|uniref:Dihydrofolate reductase n=1 Tax=Lelliottia aquatilis TaxID=2080838 RepID=A0ABX5A493_9ENTR|nr:MULTISPECIES: 2-hydroxyacid dehydrogenase [Lelliottia]NTZ46534.1 2-hydroxyacid dehydrogenase [Lelliottia aquatilis]POZ23440.1 dihydrofolate reductase [Lelliottia aquatilis]POZ27007.1 dihydrofolate reductase [Lelliottia sp. 7254-16]POZ28059.1 dihydrofolate reductase [Lelliottia aquatilis]POZ32778.1 dihydrofolate reductase [Lelliottia aquatilis]
MNIANNRAVLLIAPVVESLQQQLASQFPLYRLYEQDDPITFLREQGENIAVVVTRGDVGVQNNVLEMLPHVGLVAIFGVGTDAVDLDYLRTRQISVTITSGVLTNDVADLAMGLLLSGARQLCQGDRFVREGRWANGGLTLGTQVSGKRIGLLGMGNIGQAIARRARGFDMEVLYTDRKKLADLDYQWCADLHTLAHESDFLVIAASGGEANRGLIDASVFNVMPKHAWLINIARGSLVDEKALIQALQKGVIAGAGLDVFDDEPNVPAELMALDNVVLQPHVASATHETRQKMSDVVFANVAAYFSGTALPNAIN